MKNNRLPIQPNPLDMIMNDAARLMDAAFHALQHPPVSKSYTNIRVTVINNTYTSPKGWLRRMWAKVF